ncbi:hypothetical protein ACFW5I_08450 [Streptomyces sp. NPDC058818]|uniref:hypothetical protein n=1 Tax=Streptomyces sp. NPDC058818 TaxID=3346640 RepID=UPI0036BC4266
MTWAWAAPAGIGSAFATPSFHRYGRQVPLGLSTAVTATVPSVSTPSTLLPRGKPGSSTTVPGWSVGHL